jgi:signal peptide peptidase SppA
MSDTEAESKSERNAEAERKVPRWRRWLPPPLGVRRPVVGVVRLSGVISTGGTFRPGLSLGSVSGSLSRAFSLSGVKAVALLINSPGGSPVQSTLIHKRVRALAEEKKVPVFVFCEDVAASGGYLIALAGDEIYADASSIVGSIGVVSAGFGFVDAIGKLGIERRVHTAGPEKMILDPFRPEKDKDVERLKSIQTDIHEVFKDLVRDRRGGKVESRDEEIFTGAFWTAGHAKELGLIDELGELRSVMRERYGKEVRLRLIQPGRGWPWRRGGLGAGGLIDEAISALEQRALWARYGL